ncbi:hypothetical protein JXA32_13535 [Candidatus Sumerlaeota bacterium]|nr:hypothetical protein [Candidatus Sumerlaeota bacterium]
MNVFTQALSNGTLLFVGAVLTAVAAALLIASPELKQVLRYTRHGLVLGSLLMLLSGAPLHPLIYLMFLAAAVAAIIAMRCDTMKPVRRRWCGAVALIAALGMILMETPWQLNPQLPDGNVTRVVVIGDSISAGLADNERTWPVLLAEARPQWNVVNLAQAGAQLADALHQADNIPDGPCIVVLEIGGNDMLNLNGAKRFADDLDRLLQKVCTPDRRVVMLELPSAPLMSEYVRAQRRLSRRYGVHLLPRRIFCAVLAASNSTTDGLHLSAKGHAAISRWISRTIEPAMLLE